MAGVRRCTPSAAARLQVQLWLESGAAQIVREYIAQQRVACREQRLWRGQRVLGRPRRDKLPEREIAAEIDLR